MQNYSVLMSVYYKENPLYLKESIESMLNQTVLTNDFVLVEDGILSNELEEIVKYYENKYSDIFNIVRNKENKGLGLALKQGVLLCKNELIARMDSDDISIPTRIEQELNVLCNMNLDMVGSNVGEFINDISNIECNVILPEKNEDIIKFSKKRNPMRHPTVLFKKSSIIKAGNYRDYYLCEDYDMWIRLIKIDAKIYNIQENLVFMRISSDFYKRRGGYKYLKSILKFKNEQLKEGFYSFREYLITALASCIICLSPNFFRDIFYKKILRSKNEKS